MSSEGFHIKMTGITGINLDKWMTQMGRIIAGAPEELRLVLGKVKMSSSKRDIMNGLGANNIKTEMLGKTLSYLKDRNVMGFVTGFVRYGHFLGFFTTLCDKSRDKSRPYLTNPAKKMTNPKG